MLVSIAHPKINYFFSNTDYIKRKKRLFECRMTHSIRQTSWRAFFLRSSLSLGDFQRFLAALETLRPLRTFGPLCLGKAAGTVSWSTEAVIAATAAFLQLRLTPVARARPSFSEANKTSLFLSIFSLEYIYLLYSLFLMLLLVACWTSVGCLLDVCCSECWTDAPAYC